MKNEIPESQPKKIKKSSSLFSFLSRLPLKEQELLAKRLGFLIKSGMPILRSLQIIKEQTSGKSRIKMMETIIGDVSNGQYLFKALERFKETFGGFTINIIRVGEMSGTLDQNLNYLSEELRRRRELKNKLISAFVYPIIITIATIGITALLIFYVFPKILPIFKSLNANLPITTKILIFGSNFLVAYGIYIFILLFFAIIGLFVLVKIKPAFQSAWEKFLMKIPIIGSIIKDYNISNLARTFGLLIQSNVLVSEALKIIAETTPNIVYRTEIIKTSEGIIRGEKISDHFQKFPKLFPHLFTQMVFVGETTGNLSDSLMYTSQYYEQEVGELTKNLSNSIEPALMILMGLVVGFIAISIITPIYSITQNIHP